MAILRLTSITCENCNDSSEEPLNLVMFFDNRSFSPPIQIAVTCPGTTAFNPPPEVGYNSDGSIYIHENGHPSRVSDVTFTLLHAGAGKASFFPLSDPQNSCELSVEYEVQNNPFIMTFALIQAFVIGLAIYLRGLFWLLIAPWKYLSFRGQDRPEMSPKEK